MNGRGKSLNRPGFRTSAIDPFSAGLKLLEPADRERLRNKSQAMVSVVMRQALDLLGPQDRVELLRELPAEIERG